MSSATLRRDSNIQARKTPSDRGDLWNSNNSDPSIYESNTQRDSRSFIANTDHLSLFETCSCKLSRVTVLVPLMTGINFLSTKFFHQREVKSRYLVLYPSINSERSRNGFNAMFVYLCIRVCVRVYSKITVCLCLFFFFIPCTFPHRCTYFSKMWHDGIGSLSGDSRHFKF
jgi:hypothetical protein